MILTNLQDIIPVLHSYLFFGLVKGFSEGQKYA
jgi:hypothetical protein